VRSTRFDVYLEQLSGYFILSRMRHLSRQRRGFVDPGTIAMIALLAVGAISLATTSRALEQAVNTDAATNVATETTATPLPPLPPAAATGGNVAPSPAPPVPSPVPATGGSASGGNAPTGTVAPMAPGDEPSEPPPNPQECRDARRQIRDQFRELNRFEKLLRKLSLGQDLDKLIALRAKLKQFDVSIASACTRDNLQEFFDAQVWDEVNAFRCKAELPQQLTQIERDFKRLDRQASPKRLALTGLDQEKFTASVEKARQSLAEAKTAVSNGSCDDANEAMQTFWQDGVNPGEMMGVVGRLYDLGTQLRRVKDESIRQQFADVLDPIVGAANDGDFREANQAMNDVFPELQQLLSKVINVRRFSGYEPRLQKLEEALRQKFDTNNGDHSNGGAPGSGSSAPAPAP